MIRLVLCVVAATLTGTPTVAQEAQEPAGPSVIASLSLGLGPGLSGRDFSGQAVFTVSHRSYDYMIRSATSSDVGLFTDPEEATDFALLFGRRMGGSEGWMRVAAGPGWVRSREQIVVGCEADGGCSWEMRTLEAWGLAGQIDLVWGPVPAFGLGVALFGNVNRRVSFGGLTFNLFLGRNR